MLLPRGVTGFDSPVDGIAVPGLREFRADCWHVAISVNAKVEHCDPVLPYTSFVSQVLVRPDSTVVILLNNSLPIVGLCLPYEFGALAFEFVDNERIVSLFTEIGKYELWSKSVLDLPITNEMCAELGPSEKRQLDYFRIPGRTRVGDVVYNNWD
jgi:hypothetical protein